MTTSAHDAPPRLAQTGFLLLLLFSIGCFSSFCTRSETLHGLATLRAIQGNPQEAASLYHRAVAIREQVYGPQHPKTIETRERLHAVLGVLGRDQEAAGQDLAQRKTVET